MSQLFKNNAGSVLNGAVLAADTVIEVTDGTQFPSIGAGEFFIATLIGKDGNGNENAWEIVKVTARTGNMLTVQRAQEGTVAVNWADATGVEMRLTAGSMENVGGSVEILDTPPAAPSPGDVWFDSVSGNSFIWYDDGTSQQWIALTNAVPPSSTVDVANITGLGTAATATVGHTAGNVVPAGGANGALTIGTNDATALTLETNNTARVTVDGAGNVGIGTSSPGAKLAVNAAASASISEYCAEFITSGVTSNAGRFMWSQNSTYGLAVALNSSGSPTANATFAWIERSTGNTFNNTLRIDSSGNVLVTGSGGLGYGVGSGGTVTQATSKSNTVTLNKPCGLITMNSAALGSGATVLFTILNTSIGTSDVFVVGLDASGITNTGNYNVWSAGGASAAVIALKNVSGGSLSEAVRLRFAIIKGAAS